MIKTLAKVMLTITAYEFIKYAAVQYMIYSDRNDEVDVPADYAE